MHFPIGETAPKHAPRILPASVCATERRARGAAAPLDPLLPGGCRPPDPPGLRLRAEMPMANDHAMRARSNGHNSARIRPFSTKIWPGCAEFRDAARGHAPEAAGRPKTPENSKNVRKRHEDARKTPENTRKIPKQEERQGGIHCLYSQLRY